jgi:FG-GAP repeat
MPALVGSARAARRRRSMRLAALALLSALAVTAPPVVGGYRLGVARGPSHTRRSLRSDGLLSLPASARAPVSAAVAANSTAFRTMPSSAGFRVGNPAQRLQASFNRSGVQINSGSVSARLSVAAVGYGRSLTPLPAVRPTARGNRVTYAHPGLSEWYSNGPLGLEQGFTVQTPPAGNATGALTIAIALSGSTHAAISNDGQSITLGRAGRGMLRYAGLSASDAHGRSLRSWLSLQAGRILLHVDAAMARYPLRIDPLVQQGSKLTDEESFYDAQFGVAVAVSSDGNTALIGANGDNYVGAAYVFTRSGSAWSEQAKLTAPETTDNHSFGVSVALSADGNTALIGDPQYNSTGAAWMFTRSAGAWKPHKTPITPTAPGAESNFGASVALSGEGTTALIGDPDEDSGGANDVTYDAGGAYVFTRSGKSWIQQGEKLAGGEEVDARGGSIPIGVGFGESVALSADGETALIGGPKDSDYEGAAWVFTRSQGAWSQQGGKLTGGGSFGESVALSADGNTALIGAPGDESYSGAAWVFARTESEWSQQAKLTAASGEYSYLGSSVALSGDGDIALVGAPIEENYVGGAWVFTRLGNVWNEPGENLTAGEESGEGRFGNSVALSPEANVGLIGGVLDNEGNGAVWTFVPSSFAPPTVTAGTASKVAETEATVDATVDPNGSEVMSCSFEYGTTSNYGSSKPCSPPPGSIETTVTAILDGLSPATTYHFRVAASNAYGTRHGHDATFTTLPARPTVETSPATEVWQGEATLNATVNPNGSEVTKCTFQYGTTAAGYGSHAPCSWLPGSGTSPVSVLASIKRLKPSTEYHFRIVARNEVGSSTSSDSVFKTLPVPSMTSNSATVVSEPGGYIGDGQDQLFDAPGAVTASGEAHRVDVRAEYHGERYSFDFSAPRGQDLEVGEYVRAVRLESNSQPGLDVSADSSGCNEDFGRFVIKDIDFNSSGQLERFWALYEQHCEQPDAPALFGEIRIGEPPTEAPEIVQPAAVEWPRTAVGSSNVKVPITVGGGESGAQIASVSLAGEDASDFRVTSDACDGATLAPDERCQMKVAVKPTAAGRRAAQLIVADKSGAKTAVPLSVNTEPPPEPPISSNSATLVSEPGDYIGFGEDLLFDEPGAVSVTGEPHDVQVEVEYDYESFYFDFAAPAGKQLKVKEYSHAERYFGEPEGPALLWVDGDGRGCSSDFGRFIIKDIHFNGSGEVERFWALYEQHCEGPNAPALFGEIRVGEPPTQAPEIVHPMAIEWPRTAVGKSGVDVPVTVGGGEAGAQIASVSLSGADVGDFSVTSDNCDGASLAPGAHCGIAVAVKPTAAGRRTAQLIVADKSGAETAVSLSVRARSK